MRLLDSSHIDGIPDRRPRDYDRGRERRAIEAAEDAARFLERPTVLGAAAGRQSAQEVGRLTDPQLIGQNGRPKLRRRRPCRPIEIENGRGGWTWFPSITFACDRLGIRYSLIWKCIALGLTWQGRSMRWAEGGACIG